MASKRHLGTTDHVVAKRPEPVQGGIFDNGLREDRHLLYERRERLDASQPSREMPALCPNTIQADATRNGRAVLHLAITA